MSDHRCLAIGCTKTVPAHIMMCLPHWKKVTRQTQARIYRAYKRGQTIATASAEWHKASDHAIAEVAEKEGKSTTPAAAKPGQMALELGGGKDVPRG